MESYDRALFGDGSRVRAAIRRVTRALRERAPAVAARLAPIQRLLVERRRSRESAPQGGSGLALEPERLLEMRDAALRFAAQERGATAARREAAARDGADDRRRLRALLVIGSLSAGGAERQLALTAAGLRRRGMDGVEVLLTEGIAGTCGHHKPILDAAAVPVGVVGDRVDAATVQRLALDARLRRLGQAIPNFLRPRASDLFGEFTARRPDVVHAWLDHTNIWAGVAAALAGVPAVVLGTRNVSPEHMPHLREPWFRDLYRALASTPGVGFIANSRAGAVDYAEWLALSPERFAIVPNAFDPGSIRAAEAASIASFRASIGAGPRDPVIAGIFRLADEKRPLLFVDAAERLLAQRPRVRVVHAGEGALAAATARAVERLPATLRERFHLLGRRADVSTILGASSLLLLVSKAEGMPNVLIEAQSLGVPVIATDAGGAAETFADGRSGILCRDASADSIAAAAGRILGDEDLHRRLASEGPRVVAERFDLDRMLDATLLAWKKSMRPGDGSSPAARPVG
ncbi:MAG TPA: glycosyltransferase [Phycisphaerales bacterium]|nr:glycosyltransferase [Phycisphaerales bacterium]HMP37922.1 glycosyltransferase [Phycisphaerales bacterium]